MQGAGAGLVSPAALAGAVSGFPPERRGSALGIWGASAGMSNLLGPLLGGLLTVAFGWRADWWALVPLTVVVAVAIARLLPNIVQTDDGGGNPAMNRIVLAATLIAALTFAVMIGAFYIAEQYLQRVAGFSALGAAEGVLVSHQLPVWVTRLHLEGRRLWHDPRRRECSLCSVTSLTYDGDRLVALSYAEPAASLLPGAGTVAGA